MAEKTNSMHYYLLKCGGNDKTNRPKLSSDINIIEADDSPTNHLGKAEALYRIWKTDNSDYIGFSFGDKVLDVSDDLMSKIISNKYVLVHSPQVILHSTLREKYRTEHYDYDIRVLIEIIKKDHPTMAECLEEELLKKIEYIEPAYIIRKDVFRKICVWLFGILDTVSRACPDVRLSKKESHYLEYLAEYLLLLYIKYNSDKLKIFSEVPLIDIKSSEDDSDNNEKKQERDSAPEPLLLAAQRAVDEKNPEEIGNLLERDICNSEEDYKALKSVYEDYKRQKRYFPETQLDRISDIKKVIEEKRKSVKRPTKKILIFRWNSVNDFNTTHAFEEMGYDVSYLGVGRIQIVRQTDATGVVNNFLDQNEFDFVFSINYFDAVAEACYVHNTPYIAWAYDSPTDLGYREYLKYDTTHVFLFASGEVKELKRMNAEYNVAYMPLAADITKYDSIELSKEDIEKYSTDISFVGRLYENKLTDYMQYMSDYKKAFFNAVIDYNVGRYDSKTIESLINAGASEWFGDKRLVNAIYDGESKERFPINSKDKDTIMGRIALLTNQTCTNRERLLLVSMLSNHFDFKLYSTSSHEVFKNVAECGEVDYYREMPKVFKLSKINLNITLKSIKTGIPLRCLDIMGCHGFLLSNYQKDFDNHFKDGDNIALFHSLEEAYEKCEYYLTHEDERKRIADRGYETVKKYYNYSYLITQMLTESGLEHLLP